MDLNECFSVAKADVKLLNFAVTRFRMKSFRTTNIDVIEECKLFFDFLLPSEVFEIRRAKFNCKLMNCSNVLTAELFWIKPNCMKCSSYRLCYIYSLVKLVKFSFSVLPDVVFLVNEDYQFALGTRQRFVLCVCSSINILLSVYSSHFLFVTI